MTHTRFTRPGLLFAALGMSSRAAGAATHKGADSPQPARRAQDVPDAIFLHPGDAVMFGHKYGHPEVPQVWVGDPYVKYILKGAITAKPIPWTSAGNNIVGHVLGLSYYIDVRRARSPEFRTTIMGVELYAGDDPAAARQAAQDHLNEKLREVLG